MTADEFQYFWSAIAGTAPLITYLFKWEFSERWVRIHSLPESKCYPETPAEWQLLLQRQHTVLGDLLGNQAFILLVAGYYTHKDDPHLIDIEVFFTKRALVFCAFLHAIASSRFT